MYVNHLQEETITVNQSRSIESSPHAQISEDAIFNHKHSPKSLCFVYMANTPATRNMKAPGVEPWPQWSKDPYWHQRNIPLEPMDCLYGHYEITQYKTHAFTVSDYEHARHVLFRYQWGPHELIKKRNTIGEYIQTPPLFFSDVEKRYEVSGDPTHLLTTSSYVVLPRDYKYNV